MKKKARTSLHAKNLFKTFRDIEILPIFVPPLYQAQWNQVQPHIFACLGKGSWHAKN
jgi:hypothetical protein